MVNPFSHKELIEKYEKQLEELWEEAQVSDLANAEYIRIKRLLMKELNEPV